MSGKTIAVLLATAFIAACLVIATILSRSKALLRCMPNGTARCVQDGKESECGMRGVYRITAPL